MPPDISKLYDALPVKDSTYVVRDIRLGINLTLEGDVSVLLIGLVLAIAVVGIAWLVQPDLVRQALHMWQPKLF